MNAICEEKDLLNEQQKTIIRNMARAAGLSIDDFLWHAAMAFKSKKEKKAISDLFEELARSTERVCKNVDEATAYIDASNKRIAEMERTMRSL